MWSDASGWLWFTIEVVFVAALGAALIYGIVQWRHRSPHSEDRVAPELRDRPHGR